MKKLIIVLACLYSTITFAQNGFFLAPQVGTGFGGTNTNLYKTDYSGFVYSVDPPGKTAASTAELLLGYRFKNWEVTSGVSFLRSGFSESYASGDLIWIYTTYTERDYHFTVPLMLAYKINCCDHFFLTVGAGGAVAYNWLTTTKETDQMSGSPSAVNERHETISGSAFNDRYNRISILAKAQVQIGYKLTSRLAVVAGPEVQYMLTSLLKNTDSYQRNYTYTLNAGVRWDIKNRSKQKNSTN